MVAVPLKSPRPVGNHLERPALALRNALVDRLQAYFRSRGVCGPGIGAEQLDPVNGAAIILNWYIVLRGDGHGDRTVRTRRNAVPPDIIGVLCRRPDHLCPWS